MKTKSNTTVDIEQLMSKSPATNEVIQKALDAVKEEQAKSKQNEIIDQLRTIQKEIDDAVSKLRTVRKQEKACKILLQDFAQAQQEFYVDADYEKFLKAHGEAYNKYHRS